MQFEITIDTATVDSTSASSALTTSVSSGGFSSTFASEALDRGEIVNVAATLTEALRIVNVFSATTDSDTQASDAAFYSMVGLNYCLLSIILVIWGFLVYGFS